MRDRRLRKAALTLLQGYPLPLDLQTYILSIGIDLRAFERRFANS
jgi:hypothetical protein